MGLPRLCRWAVLIFLGAVAVAAPAPAEGSTEPLGVTAAVQDGGRAATAALQDLGNGDALWVWPLDPQPVVVRAFSPPEHDWESGHRGVDLLGTPRQSVHAIGAGTVAFAGVIAGRGVVVVMHGPLRSTYEPVTASVHAGDIVSAGDALGVLQSVQSHCAPRACLHLGLRRGDMYLDPLSLLGPREVWLKPMTDGFGQPLEESSDRSSAGGAATPSDSSSTMTEAPDRNSFGVGAGIEVGVGVASLLVGALGWRVGSAQARG